MKYPFFLLLFVTTCLFGFFSGCAVFQKKEENPEPKPEPIQYEPVSPNTPENTESYWASGAKPEKLRLFLSKSNSYLYFHDLFNGKRAGFSQVSMFAHPQTGTYSGLPEANGTIIFTNAKGDKITFSNTDPTATVFITDIGYSILSNYVTDGTPLEVIDYRPSADPTQSEIPIQRAERPDYQAPLPSPLTDSPAPQANIPSQNPDEPIQEGLVAELIPQLETMQQGPTRYGVE